MMDFASDTKKANIEDKVDHYIDRLSEYHISDEGKDEIRGYFRYLLQDEITEIPYHFIVQADSYGLINDFVERFTAFVQTLQGKCMETMTISEYQLLDEPDPEAYKKNDIIIVGPCINDENYYIGDYDDSTEKKRKSDYDYRWSKIMRFYDDYPQKLFILCGTSDIIQGRVKTNARMYYRFFKHRILINNMTVDEVYEKTLEKIDYGIGKYTIDFKYKLKEYINTVYPKADLKNTDFVDDLYKWMIALSFINSCGCEYLSENSIPYYHKTESFEAIDQEFQGLVGMEKVKEVFQDIGLLCQNMPKDMKDQPYLHMVFRGNPGTGKTTVAHFLARLLSSMRVIKKNHVEVVMTADLMGQYTGQTGPKVKRALKRAEGGILMIDEAYLLNPDTGNEKDTFREECIGTLIKAMENHSDPLIIFAGYPEEMDKLLKSNPGFSSRIGYDIEFEDYNNDQLADIFKSMCDKAGYEYDDNTVEAVHRKITALRYEDNFGNARTVENVFTQAVSECLRDNSKNRFITSAHIKIGDDDLSLEKLMSDLSSMVGIESAKKEIREQVLSCRFSKEQGKKRIASNNMIFVGNAGTGKTTTAKLLSEMLFSIGVSKSPRAKLITAKDLYVNKVSEKLNEYCREAMGGVLFIDEIYLLQSNIYLCSEIISVLLEILEERRDDITIILAGYEKQMAVFLDENQGLKSRFPITIHFDDFTEDDLCEIFLQEARTEEMDVSEEGLERFRSIIRKEMKKDNFGNGRAVRNIYEQAYRRHAVRYYENINVDPDLITEDDIDEVYTSVEHRNSIGFKISK